MMILLPPHDNNSAFLSGQYNPWCQNFNQKLPVSETPLPARKAVLFLSGVITAR